MELPSGNLVDGHRNSLLSDEWHGDFPVRYFSPEGKRVIFNTCTIPIEMSKPIPVTQVHPFSIWKI